MDYCNRHLPSQTEYSQFFKLRLKALLLQDPRYGMEVSISDGDFFVSDCIIFTEEQLRVFEMLREKLERMKAKK